MCVCARARVRYLVPNIRQVNLNSDSKVWRGGGGGCLFCLELCGCLLCYILCVPVDAGCIDMSVFRCQSASVGIDVDDEVLCEGCRWLKFQVKVVIVSACHLTH